MSIAPISFSSYAALFRIPTSSAGEPLGTSAGATLMDGSQWRTLAEKGDAEVRAAQKIADAKKELEFLQRGGFPPEVVARLAHELAGRLQGAAAEFEQAMGAAGEAGSGSIAVEAAVPSTAAASRQPSDGGVGGATLADDVQTANAKNAYQAVIDDGTSASSDPEEDKIRAELQSLLDQARQLERNQASA